MKSAAVNFQILIKVSPLFGLALILLGCNVTSGVHKSAATSTASNGSLPSSPPTSTATSTTTTTSTATSTASFRMASHSPMPTVMDQGGRVISGAVVRSFSFSSDSSGFPSQVQTFLKQFAASAEWAQLVSQYGVGGMSIDNAAVISQAPPASIDDAAIQPWLSSLINNNKSVLGNPNANNIYVINYPLSTKITAGGSSSCTDFAGYHDSFQDSVSGVMISYAVIANCSGYTINDQTETISHELVEAVTDPDNSPLTFYGVENQFNVWTTLSGGSELGDMCQSYTSSNYTPSDMSFGIQRTWSNSAAVDGSDPCAPLLPGEVYFNSSPVLTSTVTYTDAYNGNASTTSSGVTIPVGQSGTVQLQLYSTASTSAWTVSAQEETGSNCVKFSFPNGSTGSNGSIVDMTVTVTCNDPSFHASPIWIKSTQNGVTHSWPMVVGYN